jgi:hypothetical protein
VSNQNRGVDNFTTKANSWLTRIEEFVISMNKKPENKIIVPVKKNQQLAIQNLQAFTHR